MTNLVFVYGTLKRGFANHRLLEKAHFLGEAYLPRTKMINLGAYPAVIAGGTKEVMGEMYQVDDETLIRLDRLEGHPSFYERRQVKVFSIMPAVDTFIAWCYFLPQLVQVKYPTIVKDGIWHGRRA